MRIFTLAVAIAAIGGAAQAQNFQPWALNPDAGMRVAETMSINDVSGDGGWRFRAELTSSMGISHDSLSFSVSVLNFADFDPMRTEGPARQVVLTTNTGEVFRSSEASFVADGESSVNVSFGFTPMEDDDGVLQASEPNCRVVQALRRASSFTVSFRDQHGDAQLMEFTGAGSGRALAGFGAC